MVPEDEVVAGRPHDAPLALQVGGVGRGVAGGQDGLARLAPYDDGAAARRWKKRQLFKANLIILTQGSEFTLHP